MTPIGNQCFDQLLCESKLPWTRGYPTGKSELSIPWLKFEGDGACYARTYVCAVITVLWVTHSNAVTHSPGRSQYCQESRDQFTMMR